MSFLLTLLFSFLFGFFGSFTYITALLFNFVGKEKNSCDSISELFRKGKGFHFFKCLWYCSIGGFVALVFQNGILKKRRFFIKSFIVRI